MKSHALRNSIFVVIAVVIVAALAVLFGLFRTSGVAPQAERTLSPEQMKALIPRGRELALAGDCFGCHSLPQGPMGAGGLAIGTPFGTLYSTNITPDKQYGIGNYTRADFHRVMRDGIAPGNRNLYPAMPFVFTQLTTPDDIDALYAYNMSIPAMPVANKANTGAFVLPVRPFMNFWTLLNFPDRKLPRNEQRSAAWNRGAYLVEGLAHCGACHSPRNFMMGLEFSRALQGGEVDGVAVPAITAAALAKHGFDVPALSAYLATGIAPQGTAFDGMYTVTHFSTGAMEPEDVKAVATYLLTAKDGRHERPGHPQCRPGHEGQCDAGHGRPADAHQSRSQRHSHPDLQERRADVRHAALRAPHERRRDRRTRDLDQGGMGRPSRAGERRSGERPGNRGKMNTITDGPVARHACLLFMTLAVCAASGSRIGKNHDY
nr:cytochrome c [Desulfovibrio sp.]